MKVKSNKPPEFPKRQLPRFTLEIRRNFTRITCPSCGQSFYVKTAAWLRKRRWAQSSVCPFCYRGARCSSPAVPPPESRNGDGPGGRGGEENIRSGKRRTGGRQGGR